MKKFLFLSFLAIFIVGCTASLNEINEVDETASSNENIESDDEGYLSISREELSENNNGDSCWVAYQGQVYDLTDWLRQHPGGAQAILPNCGTAEQFEEAYNERHGERDSGLLRNQPIGEFNG